MKKRVVLITGAAGFLGSHLCDRFVSEGFRVIGLDNLLTGRASNLRQLENNPAFTFLNKDVTSSTSLNNGDLDIVLHFACPASPMDYQKHPIQTLKVDSLGTFNTLDLVLKKGARYVLASTSEIYGDPVVHPQPETYWGNVNPIGVRSVYDEAKRFSEALTMAYHREHGLDTRILRIFNTYGPRMRLNDGRVIPSFLTQALSRKPITVYGEGRQTRSFCYIDDLVEGIFRFSTYENLNGEVMNLGSPQEFTVLELAKTIIELTKTSSEIVFNPLPMDDPARRRPDISKARKIIEWSPETALKDGIVLSIPYFKEEIEEERTSRSKV